MGSLLTYFLSNYFTEDDIPSLEGKVALVTGGASGIGLETVKILTSKGCKVYILDVFAPAESTPERAHFIHCDVTSWSDLVDAFTQAKRIDIAIANADVLENRDFLEDRFNEAGALLEPQYELLDVNLKGVLNFVKLALSYMRRQRCGGSVVMTSSSTAYTPEQTLPIYAASKSALIGVMRALRSMLPDDNISINAVAPAAVATKLLGQELAEMLTAAGIPVSTPRFVALAIVFSATARQEDRVEDYGKDKPGTGAGKWNGRTIFTLGEEYTELEEGISRLKPQWLGKKNTAVMETQQALSDDNGQRRVLCL